MLSRLEEMAKEMNVGLEVERKEEEHRAALEGKDEELRNKDVQLKRAISEIAELRRRLPRAAEEEVSEHAGRAGGD